MKHVLPRFLRPVWPCVNRRLVVRPRLEILLRRCKSCGKRQQQKEGRKEDRVSRRTIDAAASAVVEIPLLVYDLC